MRRIRLLSLLFVATLLVQNAAAAILPYSSYYRGRSYFNNASVSGYVDFAVYDTDDPLYGDEWTFAAPGSGQFIYAYQIFSDSTSTDAIEFFNIMGKDGHQLPGINTMNTQNPWEDYTLITEGVAPTNTFPNTNPSETIATWEFVGGLLVHDEYSWFLIFSSNSHWVEGEYEIETASGIKVPGGNPEPCTLALLGLGSTVLLAKRKNSVVKMAHAVKSHRV